MYLLDELNRVSFSTTIQHSSDISQSINPCVIDSCWQWKELHRCCWLVNQPEADVEDEIYERWWQSVWSQSSWPVWWSRPPAGGQRCKDSFNWAGTRSDWSNVFQHFLRCLQFFLPVYTSFLKSQVADLDDEFAELLLTDFSENFDAIPSYKVSLANCSAPIWPFKVHQCCC